MNRRMHRSTLSYVESAMEFGERKPGRSRGDYLSTADPRATLRAQLEAIQRHAAAALAALAQGDAVAPDAESGLPHLAHVAARVNIAVAVGVHHELLPELDD